MIDQLLLNTKILPLTQELMGAGAAELEMITILVNCCSIFIFP